VLGLDARGDETVEDVTEEKVQEFVGAFLKHVEEREAPQETWEAVIEEVEEEGEGETASAASAAPAGGSEAKAPTETSQAVSDKALRKLLGTLTMDFNSGMANLKKALDDLTDTPQLIPSKAPALTQLLGSLELKVKKDMLQVKRELMDLGKRKDEL
jgi:ABC-type nitrate/sulfonate/bicarbonate transport system substrate-binding protein